MTPDDVEAAIIADDIFNAPKAENFYFADVTESLREWQSSGSNFGWGLINSGTDGWDFITSELAELYPGSGYEEYTPRLTIYYTIPGDLNNDGAVDRHDLMVIKSYLRQPATECPECDINGDGRISILDARKLIRMCDCPRCICR